jgi:Ca2+-binding RTX toxin-like protein
VVVRRLRPLLLAAILVVPTLGSMPPARAAITSDVTDGVLTVRSDAGDDYILVDCSNGDVVVSFEDPGNGPAACDTITKIDIRSGSGNDRVYLDAVLPSDFPALRSVRVALGGGIDAVVGTTGPDTLLGGGAIDRFVLVQGDDRIVGGSGEDQVTISTKHDVELTDSRLVTGEDRISLDSVETVRITGEGRSLRIDARRFHGPLEALTDAGRDVVVGGPRNDTIATGAGDDLLVGNGGDDKLTGSDGDDTLRGGGGTDFLFGGAGHDRCDGGPGYDRVDTCEA